MDILVNRDRLSHELARRGWTVAELAVRAGVSAPTVTAVMAGRLVRPSTVKRIALAISKAPVVDGIDQILTDEGGGDRDDGSLSTTPT
jgi:transcriptional regulator with XRE-family HTH domain